MVIGGGIAGLTAAWELSRFDIDVELIEKTPFLGGYAIRYCCKATDECRQCGACTVEAMLKNVVDEPKIKVHLATEVEKINNNGKISVNLKKGAGLFSVLFYKIFNFLQSSLVNKITVAWFSFCNFT